VQAISLALEYHQDGVLPVDVVPGAVTGELGLPAVAVNDLELRHGEIVSPA